MIKIDGEVLAHIEKETGEDYKHTVGAFIEALTLLSLCKEGLSTQFLFEGHHDVVTTMATTEEIPMDSENGKRLIQSGRFDDEGYWTYFT
jgi:hypothetical protein